MTNGQVRPETMQRVYDEELTFVAENMNRPLFTEFALQKLGDELVYFDRGEWRPYIGTLIDGLRVAQEEVKTDYRRDFLADRAAYDLEVGYRLISLQPGESLVWSSAFPEEEFYQFGGEFLREVGFQVERRMGFIYQAEKTSDGQLILRSQSVDNSDPEALRAVEDFAKTYPDSDISTLIRIYDATLEQKHGLKFKAGRPETDEVEAWEFIHSQRDLVEHYFRKLEELADMDHRTERAKKELTYGFWAALKDRLNMSSSAKPILVRGYNDAVSRYSLLDQEMNHSFQRAVARHEQMVGCGGIIRMTENSPGPSAPSLIDMSPEDAIKEIFGDKSEKLIWKRGVCRIQGCPTRPRETKVAQCQVCQGCQHLFDKGKDPVKVYGTKPMSRV